MTTYYPLQWEGLSKAEILSGLPTFLDSNHHFHLAEWEMAVDNKGGALYHYLSAIGQRYAHIGIFSRAFEFAFCDGNYWLATVIASEAVTRFSDLGSAYIMLARAAASAADEESFRKNLKLAEEYGSQPDEIANVKKYSSHFFMGA